MDIKRALPCPELRSVVRSFEERRADLGSAVLSWPVAARPFPERQNSAVVGGRHYCGGATPAGSPGLFLCLPFATPDSIEHALVVLAVD